LSRLAQNCGTRIPEPESRNPNPGTQTPEPELRNLDLEHLGTFGTPEPRNHEDPIVKP
jgi:hypothetical protein